MNYEEEEEKEEEMVANGEMERVQTAVRYGPGAKMC